MAVKNATGEIIGVVQVLNKRDGAFTEEDEELLRALAAQAAVALDNSNLFEEVLDIKNYNESILRDMATGVVTLDEEGKISTVNPAAQTIFAIWGSEHPRRFAILGTGGPATARPQTRTPQPPGPGQLVSLVPACRSYS